MTWIALVLYSKKAWIWCRYHWKILSLALWTLIVYIVARKNVRAYKKVLETTIESYNKEIEVLEGSHKGELEKRTEVIVSHNEALSKLEKNYAGSLNELSIEKRVRYLELVSMLSEDPEVINRLIEEEFGFKYVE